MFNLDPTLTLARITARRSQTDHFAATTQGIDQAAQLPERNTFQGHDPTTGLLKRQPLANVPTNAVGANTSPNNSNGLAIIADGVKVFNRSVRIGRPIWTIPTAGNARLIAQYIKRQAQGDNQVLRRRPILKSPQAVTWMALNVSLGGNLFDLPYSFIPTYAAYVGAPFATPANFTQFNPIRNFTDQGEQIQLNASGGISNTIFGTVNTSDTAFSANYATRVVGFSYQIFRTTPGSLNINATLEQDDGIGGTSVTTTVSFVGTTGSRQANGLYLISFDQSVFPASVLNINNVAKRVTVSMNYANN